MYIFVLIVFLCGFGKADEVLEGAPADVSAPAVSSMTQEIAQKVQTIQTCSNQVWPQLKLGQYPLYVADYNGTTQLNTLQEINPATGQVTSAPSAANNHIRNARYSRYFTDVPSGGKTGVAVSIGGPRPGGGSAKPPAAAAGAPAPAAPKKPQICSTEDSAYSSRVSAQTSRAHVSEADQAVNLLMHEAFHNVDQNPSHACNHGSTPWNSLSKESRRHLQGVLPNERDNERMESQSMAYRAAMIYNLRKALETPSRRQAYMREAARWYNKWQKEFGTAVEALRGVDRQEGSASYVGSMAAAIGEAGCQDSESRRASFLRQTGSKLITVPTSVDAQAYGLGAGAGALLDALGDPSWKQKVMQGKTPMEVLAETLAEKPPQSPQPVPGMSESQTAYDNLNRCLKNETLSSVREAYSNPTEYVAVAIKIESTLGHPAGPFLLGENSWQLSSYGSDVLGFDMKNWPQVRSGQNACGTGTYSIILVPKDQLTNGQFNVTSSIGSASGDVGAAVGSYGPFGLHCAQ